MTPKRPITAEEALGRCQRLCAASEQCSDDLLKKMRGWGLMAGDAQKILKQLQEEKFVDDERFALAFARDKVRFNGWGRRKVAAAMSLKRIPRGVIDRALGQVSDDDMQAALLRALRTKGRQLGDEASTREGWQKMARHAASRGFDFDHIMQALRSGLWRKEE